MNALFPFKSYLSLGNLIGYWELKQYDENPLVANQAKGIIELVKKAPELSRSIEDISILENHKNVLQAMMRAVFPDAIQEEQIVAAFKPFSMDYFFASKKFHQLIEVAGCMGNMTEGLSMEEMVKVKTIAAYQAILNQFYGVEFPSFRSFVLNLKDENGLVKYFRLNLNPKFCEIKVEGDTPELSKADIHEIVENLDNLDYVGLKLPHERFSFHGFSLYTMVDATAEEVVSSIKEDLLQKDSIINDIHFGRLEEKFRSLLELPKLKIGLSAYKSQKNNFFRIGGSNLSGISTKNPDYFEPFLNINSRLIGRKTPIVIKNISESTYFKGYEHLFEGKSGSVIFCPLYIDDEFIGVLDLYSPQEERLTILSHHQIVDVLPLFSIALKRSSEEIENRIQSIIKENYTSIHPAVEWKFTEAAYKILEKEERGETAQPDEIVLKDVYPLYAVSDIRNSSSIRNESVVADLSTQLKLAKSVLSAAKNAEDFPLIGEISFRIGKVIKKLKQELISGDESSIIHFISNEVEPIIKNIEREIEGFEEISSKYWKALDPSLKIVYQKRKSFESSLTQINETVSAFLEAEQEKAQKVFPHFFERYKTDGVEYNIYIGSSITNTRKFDPLYLRNIRLWQLVVTAEIARILNDLKPKLSLPLDTAHLILVHNQPLAVRFRMDEKQFDVDGAYNMRYEIVKKRIDKVHIKGTEERLTQPGKIAVVFSQDEDAKEYKSYFEYLQHKGFIASGIEELELEELQGVSGLKALRVSVEPAAGSFMDEIENLKQTSLSA